MRMSTRAYDTTVRPLQEQLDAFVLEVLPCQGRWQEDEYLWLTDHSRRLVKLTDGYLELLPMPTDEHQSILAHLYERFSSFLLARGRKGAVRPPARAGARRRVS